MGPSNRALHDPRYQQPLEAGWWKTVAGWRSILKSHRIDRRAKPIVIVFILAIFLLVGLATQWKGWGLYAAAAGLLILVVSVFSPLDVADYRDREPLEPGWWRSASGWRQAQLAGLDEPGMAGATLVVGLCGAALLLVVSGGERWGGAMAVVSVSSRGFLPVQYRWLTVAAGLALVFAGAAS
ncbi:MAG: hypothetical protein GY926_10465 [bacterium]|nr:hypothetical protein [bacterium]